MAIETVETTAIRSPPMIAGTASGSSTRQQHLARLEPHAARRLEHVGRRRAEARR